MLLRVGLSRVDLCKVASLARDGKGKNPRRQLAYLNVLEWSPSKQRA